jgi:hypothetical protein
MSGRFVPRLLAALLILAGIIGLGFYAYQLGVAQGVAQNAPVAPAGAAAVPGPYYGYPHPFFPFWGFGCFGVLIPLFLLMLIFGGLRRMFWGGHMGHMGYGGWRSKWSEGGAPPMFEEWHKRAHEPKVDAPDEAKPDPASQGSGKPSKA